jgi:hypothetical protein
MASLSARLERVKDDPMVLIDPRAVEEACRACGHRWRERQLDPVRTLGAMIAQIAHGNTAMSFLVRLLGGTFSESAYCQARARLPVSVVRAAAEAFTQRVLPQGAGRWHGHRCVLIDGTGITTPDTPELRELLGVAAVYAPGCGLPFASVLASFDAHSDLLLGMHAAPAGTSDAWHAHRTLELLEPGDVAVGDRGLCSYVLLALLIKAGAHGVFRMPGTRAMPFPAKSGQRERHAYNRHRRQEPILVSLMSENDQVVTISKPHNRPKHVDPEVFAGLPSTMVVRAVRYRVQQPGWRSWEITLMTDLVDAERYPAEDLAALYLSRWRIEVNLRSLKRTLGMHRLKCQSVQGITRELAVFALVYNAVCVLRARAAAARGVALKRVSFVDALRWMLLESGGVPTILGHPPDLKLWPLRPPRSHPRLLKHGNTSFGIMHKPRSEFLRPPKAQANSAN